MPSLEQEIRDLENDIEENENLQNTCRERLQATIRDIGLPKEWDAAVADRAVTELQNARAELQKAAERDARIAEMRKNIDEYESKVSKACESLAPELSDLPAEAAAARIAERLADADKAQNTHGELTKSIATAQVREKAKTARIESLQQKLEQFRETAEAGSDEEFYRVAAEARQKADLQKEIVDLNRDIQTAAATEDVEAFRARLADADADLLGQELRSIEAELAEAETQIWPGA